MPFPLLPDTVALAREALLAQTSITALVSTRIYARIPATPTWPLLVVSTVDDAESPEPAFGESRVQVDVWGAGGSDTQTAQARLIARTVWQAARDLDGSYTSGVIVHCTPLISVPAPDPETGRARFVVDLSVTIR